MLGSALGLRPTPMFQSAPPARGATPQPVAERSRPEVSIRAPRAGGDLIPTVRAMPRTCFNPRPPRGGRLGRRVSLHARMSFNPRPPRGGRPHAYETVITRYTFQSAPPAREATRTPGTSRATRCFNPRPPRGGRPEQSRRSTNTLSPFQSAPPARGATRPAQRPTARGLGVSIRAPRAGGDATNTLVFSGHVIVSIRAPRAGGDLMASPHTASIAIRFNPRPPRGGRPVEVIGDINDDVVFQSAPPARGATGLTQFMPPTGRVSIRAPRAGGDRCRQASIRRAHRVSIRAPRAGGDT